MSEKMTEQQNADQFSSDQWITTPLPEYRGLVVRSGVAQVNFGGGAAGSGWTRGTVSLQLDLRPAIASLAGGQPAQEAGPWTMKIEQSAVQAALSSFTNAGQAVNAGWAVDDARLAPEEGGVEEVRLEVDLAVSDDSLIYRISFMITLVGKLRRPESGGGAAASDQEQRGDG